MTSSTRRAARTILAGLVIGLATLTAPSVGSAQTTSTTTTTTPGGSGGTAGGAGVTINGEGSNGPYREVITWQNDLAGAQSAINLNYTASGTLTGRGDFLAGNADFALSGTQFAASSKTGFTQDEIKLLPHKDPGRDLIAAPVQVTALAFVATPPFGGFQRIDQFCDTSQDPAVCDPAQPLISPVTREIRIPNQNLAGMMLNANLPDPNHNDSWGGSISAWNAFDVLNAFTISPPQCNQGGTFLHCLQGLGATTHPVGLLQSEGDESNYYLQQFIRTTAPNVWNANKAADTHVIWEDPTTNELFERMPRQPALSRQGADQAGDQLTIPGGTAGGTVGGGIAGAIGTLPPTAKIAALQGQLPGASPLQFVALQNKHGDWVQPNTLSITAAVKAGGATPLFALNNDAAGAYPLAWVNYMYVKASGLSADKTEALATLIRYLATDGQGAAQQWGEGILSAPLATQALKAADQVVQSNCPGAHGTIVQNSAPGPDAPNLPGLKAIGPMLHCIPPAPPVAGLNTLGASTNLSLPGLPSLPTTPAQTPTPTPALKPGAVVLPAALTSSKLPLPFPGTPLDRIATLVLGGLFFLIFEDPIRRLLGRAVE